MKYTTALGVIYISILFFNLALPVQARKRDDEDCGILGTLVVGGLAGVATVVAAPALLAAAGFTGAGIAAGSFGASMMSTAAIANGGGVAAGSAVALLQSAGAAGLAVGTKAAIVGAGAATGAALGARKEKKH